MCISYTILLKFLLKTNFFFFFCRKLTGWGMEKSARPDSLYCKGFQGKSAVNLWRSGDRKLLQWRLSEADAQIALLALFVLVEIKLV